MEKVIEEFNHEIKADKNHAQILIEITPASETLGEVKKIIEDLGTHIIETKHLSSNRALLKLDVKDMRNVALKLTESGFFNVKEVNASPSVI